MSNSTEPLFIVWPMQQFQKDFEILDKIGEGHYGKVFSAKQRNSTDRTKQGHRYNVDSIKILFVTSSIY